MVLSYIFGLVAFYFDSTVAGPERGIFRPGKDLEPALELKLSGALSDSTDCFYLNEAD